MWTFVAGILGLNSSREDAKARKKQRNEIGNDFFFAPSRLRVKN
jgi:hypothetical protein